MTDRLFEATRGSLPVTIGEQLISSVKYRLRIAETEVFGLREQGASLLIPAHTPDESRKRIQNFTILGMKAPDMFQCPVQRFPTPSSKVGAAISSRQVPQCNVPILKIAACDGPRQPSILSRKPAVGSLQGKNCIIQQRQTIIAMDNARGVVESEPPTGLFQTSRKNVLLVVKLRDVCGNEVQFYLSGCGALFLTPNILNDTLQAAQILFVREKAEHDGIGQLARANAGNIGMTSA
jgi:hypothetical protein